MRAGSQEADTQHLTTLLSELTCLPDPLDAELEVRL